MAVWGYDQLDIDSLQVKSILYRDISELIGRSVKSVEYKLQNVSSFDPRPRLEKPITEAKNAQALLGKVFKWYWSNKHKAREMYEQYRSEFLFNLPSIEFEPKIDHVIENTIFIEEGASETSTFKRRKRSQKLLEEGRKYFKNIENDGLLRCKACGFIAPPTIDKEIVQLHHTKPIYDLTESGRNLNVVNAILELLPLCPTCHSLAHTSRPPLELEQIKTLRQS